MREQPVFQPLLDKRRHQSADIPAQFDHFLHQAGADEGVGLRGHHENCFDIRAQFAIHERHLSFVVIVACRSKPSDDHCNVNSTGEIYEESMKSLSTHPIPHLSEYFLNNRDAFGGREKWLFRNVIKNPEGNGVAKSQRSPDKVVTGLADVT